MTTADPLEAARWSHTNRVEAKRGEKQVPSVRPLLASGGPPNVGKSTMRAH